MSLATGFYAPVNGLPPRPTEIIEASEYQKILGIYNQVKAGTHPRLKLSEAARPKPRENIDRPPSLPNKVVPAIPAVASLASQSTPTSQPSGGRFNVSAREQLSRIASMNTSSAPLQPVPSRAPVSELDPIFLTKSEDLVRAELQLQRQRAERVLREQLEQKRADARHKPSPAEAKPDFDIADVLAKALTRVKPLVFDKPRGTQENATASDSFDENSFYSSKAPDSASRDEDDLHISSSSKNQVQPVDKTGRAADGLVDRRDGELQQVDLTASPHGAHSRPVLRPAFEKRPHHDPVRRQAQPSALAPIAIDGDEDEPEYSPPEPSQPSPKANGEAAYRDQFPSSGRRASGRHPNHWHNTQRHKSPVDTEVRIVRSYIKSPIAPQPSRVSPLALAKGPPLSQNRRHPQEASYERRAAMVDSERTSPDIASSAAQPRKRRKLQNGKRPAGRRDNDSPDPIIKDEPVSPPPFHDMPPLGAARHRQMAERATYIDLEPPRYAQFAAEQRLPHSPSQAISEFEGQAPHSASRVLSRAGQRDAPRSNQDLRRVASLQNLPARSYVEPTYQAPTRAFQVPPYALDEATGRPRQSEMQPHFSDRAHVLHQSPAPSTAYREVEFDGEFAIQPMAPPKQRRVVVDEYGQQFYESLPPPRAAISHAANRRQEIEGYNERPTMRHSVTRPDSVFEEPHRETRYVQEMPPPQVVYRRIPATPISATSDFRFVTDTSGPSTTEYRYATKEFFEPRQSPRSGNVQTLDYPARQPVYLEDNVPSREPAVRVSSVRPTVRAYEEPRELIQRVASVRPEARQWGDFPEELPRGRREQMQLERPVYEVRRTAEGNTYYRIDDGGRTVVERPMETRGSYGPRH